MQKPLACFLLDEIFFVLLKKYLSLLVEEVVGQNRCSTSFFKHASTIELLRKRQKWMPYSMAIFGQRRKDFSPKDMTNNFLLTDEYGSCRCMFVLFPFYISHSNVTCMLIQNINFLCINIWIGLNIILFSDGNYIIWLVLGNAKLTVNILLKFTMSK